LARAGRKIVRPLAVLNASSKLSKEAQAVINLVTQLIGSSSSRSGRYVSLFAVVALVVLAALMGLQDPDHG
jgi:hypothetical protein